MMRVFNRRRFCWVTVIAIAGCLAVASFGSPVVAAAQAVPSISPTAQEQLAAIRAEKQSRTPVQRKIDSRLLYAVKKARGAAFPLHFPDLQSKVNADPQGKVTVDVHGRLTPTLLAHARRVGATLVSAVPQSHAVRLRVALSRVEDLAASPDLTFIAPASEPELATGRVDSEGDTTHRAKLARSAFRVNGTGAKIGVLSDGVKSLATSQASGDLGPVTVLPGQAGPADGDEGTAMLEIVHDLAPGAQLYFATAWNSEASFAQNIRNLRSAGANIIIDDVQYYDESPFQDGPVARAVNDVTASGALYFSSAGNEGNLDDRTSGVWEGDFAPSTTSGPLGIFADFDPTAAVQIYNPVALIPSSHPATLHWADPYGGSANDYDLYLFDAAKNIIGVSNNYQTGTQDPYEQLVVPGSQNGGTAGRSIGVARFSGQARFMHLSLNRGRFASSGTLTAYATAGQTSGHNAAVNAFSVAATPAARAHSPGEPVGPYPNPFTRSNVSETFTSDGPRRMFYAADGTPYTPGNFTSSGGIVRRKPDITAADGVATTVSKPGLNPFFGTSAAAPHAAAIAALLLNARPGITPAQVRTRLTSTAIDIEKAGWDRDTGAGIIDAYAALRR